MTHHERKHDTRTVPRREETKPNGKGGRKSELFIVPLKAGNQLNGTRRREGGATSWNQRRDR